MNFYISNVGKIGNVRLDLNGITVLIGNNNTGKSTIGKALFSFFESFYNIEKRINYQKNNLTENAVRNILFQEFNRNDERYSSVSYNSLRRIIAYVNGHEVIDYEEIKSIIESMNFENAEDVTKHIFDEIIKINNLPLETLTQSAITEVYEDVFHSSIVNYRSISLGGRIEAIIKGEEINLDFEADNCKKYESSLDIINKAIYIDDPFIIDYLNKKRLSEDNLMHRQLIHRLRCKREEAEGVVAQSYIANRINKVLLLMDDLGLGELEYDAKGELVYKAGSEKYPLDNVSTGIKSFAIIKTLLLNGQLSNKDVLILDEPEIHLHPEWQLKYAELIVLLQKEFDLTVLITTHSQVFLEAIELYSKKYNRGAFCNYYYAKKDESGNYNYVDSTNNMNTLYSQIVNPSIELNKLRWSMEKDE